MPISSGTKSTPLASKLLTDNAWWPYAFLTLAVLAVYANVYDNTFLLDDEFLLQRNAWLSGWSHIGDIFLSSTTAGAGGEDSFYRPLQIFFYFLVYKIFGLWEPAFHALNVGLHALNTGMVFALGTRLGLKRSTAVMATLLWAVHPLHTEAVTYMSATADPLHVTFVLSALLVWKEKNAAWQWMAAGLFILGLLAKETALVMPALLFVILMYKEKSFWPRQAIQSWSLWGIALLYLVARGTVLDFDNSYQFYKEANIYTENMPVRVFTFLATLPDYLRLLVWPTDLHMERATTVYATLIHPKVLLGAGIFLFLPLLALLTWRKSKSPVLWSFLFSALWFFAAYFPCSGILVPVNSFFLEHWMYLPAIGLVLGFAASCDLLIKSRELRFIAALSICFAILCFTFLTWQQNSVWRTPVSFYKHILQFEEGTARVHNNLAMAYQNDDADDLAYIHYRKAIETEDTYAETNYNLARLLLKRGRKKEAVRHLKRALEINPRFRPAEKVLEKLKK